MNKPLKVANAKHRKKIKKSKLRIKEAKAKAAAEKKAG
jgi:hypothetical protein